jgi:hypothetical protein
MSAYISTVLYVIKNVRNMALNLSSVILPKSLLAFTEYKILETNKVPY